MSATHTINETSTETIASSPAQPSVSLHPPQEQRGVSWSTDTVDNENLNRKSSKCCCIYKKSRTLGESSSESDISDNDVNPYEKKIKKKKRHSHKHHSHDAASPSSKQAASSPSKEASSG